MERDMAASSAEELKEHNVFLLERIAEIEERIAEMTLKLEDNLARTLANQSVALPHAASGNAPFGSVKTH